MDIDFNLITKEDVIKTVEKFLKSGEDVPLKYKARSSFLIYDNKKLPAKYMLRLAYKEATGNEIEPADHHGGNSVLNVFKKLGFKILHLEERNPKTIQKLNQRSNQNRKEVMKGNRMQIPTRSVTEQKNTLQLILNKIFDGDIVSGKTFDCL